MAFALALARRRERGRSRVNRDVVGCMVVGWLEGYRVRRLDSRMFGGGKAFWLGWMQKGCNGNVCSRQEKMFVKEAHL